MLFDMRVYDRAGADVLVPGAVRFEPMRWSAEAVGGPKVADIDLHGDALAMLSMGGWLGYGIEIYADGELVWWGQIESLSVVSDGLARELTLRDMANRVKVVYSVREAGGTLSGQDTGWLEDAGSVASYGARELVHSASGSLTEEQALALRARLLAALAMPLKRLRVGAGRSTGRMGAVGYWQRLGDVYYAQNAGLEEYADGGGVGIPVGLGVASAYLGFGGTESAKRISAVLAEFTYFPDYNGLKLVVSGTTSNNGVKTVAGGDRSVAFSYTANSIRFEEYDDIHDSAIGLGEIANNDVLWISGASSGANNGAKLVKSTGVAHIEISPGWSGGNIVTATAGPSVTILRGNSITVEESVANEAPNGSTVETITAYGQRVYQTFALAANTSWTVAKVEIRACKIGAPSDNLRVQLVLDSAGSPGTVLETVSVAAGDIDTAMGWISFTFSNTALLTYGTTYGLIVDRTGSMEPLAFYEVDIVVDGDYSRGAMKLYDGSAYQADPGDMLFRVLGAQDTALQMQQVIEGAGVELGTVLVETTSGVSMLQYQSGDETALAISRALIEQGTASGERILCTVTRDGNVRLFERPASSNRFIVWRDGALRPATGGKLANGWLPVGEWVHVDDLAMVGAWAGLSPVFVERATYQVGSGLSFDAEYQETLAGALSGVRQG